MSFTATCPQCDAPQRLSSESRGKRVTCPECGESYPARPATRKKPSVNPMTYLVLGLLALVVLGAGTLLFFLVLRKSPDVPQPPIVAAAPVAPPVPAVQPVPATSATQPALSDMPILTSDAFRQEFARNPDGADGKYRNRSLEITGTISSLQDLSPLRGVIIGTLQDAAPPIACDLTPDQAAVFAKLKPGQKVTIRGVFMGKTAEGFLGFSKCQVVPK